LNEETTGWAEQLSAVEAKLGEAYEQLAALRDEMKSAGNKKESTAFNEPMERLARYARLFAEIRASWSGDDAL